MCVILDINKDIILCEYMLYCEPKQAEVNGCIFS